MRRTKKLLLLVLCMGIAIPLYSVFSQSATNQTWTSEIAYFNTEDASGTLNITFYDSNGDVTSTDPIALSPYQSGTLLIGSISSLGSDFSGSAVMSADVQLAAVYIEFVSGVESDDYDRKLYNGFTPVSAANTFYIPSVLKQQFGSTSQVGIQNVDASLTATLTLEFYAVGATEPTYVPPDPLILDPQSSYIFSMNDINDADIPPGFTGSLKITSEGGDIVASAEETYDDDRFAYAFEGVSEGDTKVYIPTMLCRYGPEQQISYFAIQAVGGSANVTLTHYDREGNQISDPVVLPISDGGKLSANPCVHGEVPDGSIGSSVIESDGAPIIVLVKVNADIGMRTAYIAEGTYEVTGSVAIYLPWVQWNDDATLGYQSYIAVQNIGDTAAEDIIAYYYNNDGSDAATHVLADSSVDSPGPLGPMIKTNTFAHTNSAGAAVDGEFSGAVIIVSDQPILVTVRNQTDVDLGETTRFSEDYTGIRYP